MRPAIRVERLGKLYRIGGRQPMDRTLREAVMATLAAPVRRAAAVLRGREAEASDDEIWALRDLSFAVAPGEVVGIIGRNGAGKSTLLKILSRITEPTTGRFGLKGRVGSLLEVGTGFHPELTGRENIALNGAVLGMRRHEIQRKFDAIVAFAGIDRFLDTQVKHYSSGMYMRLAFAVAAHLEPEILLVDEVLAVGDAAFQKQCLGKMGEVAHEGRTVLFVSHNMHAVRSLCPRCLLIDGGRLAGDGATSEVIATYFRGMAEAAPRAALPAARPGSGALRLTEVALEDAAGTRRSDFAVGEAIRLRVGLQRHAAVADALLHVGLKAGHGWHWVTSLTLPLDLAALDADGRGSLLVEVAGPALRAGEYPVCVTLGGRAGQTYDVADETTAPIVVYAGPDGAEAGFGPAHQQGYFALAGRVVGGLPRRP
ncbi:MAG TPA: polysaccharide ABC transporter ATP-binding protein [Polyangia bacterium]|jgi:ABC-type polysaccharide/polyol phosphate transport system ATPase subunit